MNRPSKPLPRYSIFLLTAFICLNLIFPIMTARAEQATPAEMERVCQNWLTRIVELTGTWGGSIAPAITTVDDIVVDDTLLARCYNISPQGFVLVPILTAMPPVKAYSDEFPLNLDEPDGMAPLLREILQSRARMYVEAYGSLDAAQPDIGVTLFDRAHRVQWDRFRVTPEQFAADKDGKDIIEQGGPLLTTAWHQGSPYNNLCPAGDGSRCVVGCVATATAQILRYWQWPPAGEGTHTYWWGGDNSCEGSTPGVYLSADYNDEYLWDDSPAALAELCYEVGVAFNMDYGACGSGAYTADAAEVFPTYFRYRDWANVVDRGMYSQVHWYNIIKSEINESRPMQYRIRLHSIVCDGYRDVDGLLQYHMNYGWGGGSNAWYALDNLYCSWEPDDLCPFAEEYLVRNIEPDMGVMFTADTTYGWAPLTVSFTGESDLSVDGWAWDFGDGDSAYVQSPIHVYDGPGVFDVNLEIQAEGDTRNFRRREYLVVIADSVFATDAEGAAGNQVEIILSARNGVPINGLKIPIEYGGDLDLTYASHTADGCRTEYFEETSLKVMDTYNKRLLFFLQASEQGTSPHLEPGFGEILKVYFTIGAGSTGPQSELEYDGYPGQMPEFFGAYGNYQPDVSYCTSTITLTFLCGDADGDGGVNLLDIVHLINYKYKDGPAPNPFAAGNVNGDDTINLLDIVDLINFKYKDGAGLNCP